jgi:uncharacterized protein YceK
MKRVSIALVCLVLAGCAGSASDKWSKPGIKAETADSDLSDCQDQARSATRRDAGIDADITATLGQDWQRGGVLGMKRDDMASSNRALGQQIVARCMAAKGYSPVR